jgi:hypothetical protein
MRAKKDHASSLPVATNAYSSITLKESAISASDASREEFFVEWRKEWKAAVENERKKGKNDNSSSTTIKACTTSSSTTLKESTTCF